MRDGAATQTLVAAGRALQVIIAACRVRYQQRGAVLPYEVELEVVPQLASSQPTDGTSSFAGLTTSDAATALAAVQTALVLGTADAGLTSAASALAPLSSAVAGSAAYVAALNGAGAGLSVSLAANGDTITTIADDAANGVCADAASLASAVEAAGLIAGAAQAGRLCQSRASRIDDGRPFARTSGARVTAAANRKRAHPSVLAAVALDPLMNEAARRLDGALFELGEQIPQGKFVILLSVLIANVINANPSLDVRKVRLRKSAP